MTYDEGYGSVSELTFYDAKSPKGKERTDKLFEIFNDHTDREIAEILYSSWVTDRECFDIEEEYEKGKKEDLLLYMNVEDFCDEKCVAERLNDYSFKITLTTFYGTPFNTWSRLVDENKRLTIDGHVYRNYASDYDGEHRVFDAPFFMNGRFYCYPFCAPDEENFLQELDDEYYNS